MSAASRHRRADIRSARGVLRNLDREGLAMHPPDVALPVARCESTRRPRITSRWIRDHTGLHLRFACTPEATDRRAAIRLSGSAPASRFFQHADKAPPHVHAATTLSRTRPSESQIMRPLLQSMPTLLTLTALALPPAHAAERCFDFGRLTPGAEYAVNATVPIDIGKVHVRDLRLDGQPVAQKAENIFLRVLQQNVAGGVAPELYGKNVAVQMQPSEAVHRIALRFSHQPGADGARAAMVEVNGVRHDWQGAMHKLDGQVIGAGTPHEARFKVRQPNSTGEAGWISGELQLESRQGIKSFTIGAAELRLDDVCFAK
jgi:hypothetical protein